MPTFSLSLRNYKLTIDFLCCQNWNDYVYGTAPPMPKFGSGDNRLCKDYIEGLYEEAVIEYSDKKGADELIDADLQIILDKKAANGVDFVGNQAFLDWVVSDWETSYIAQNDPDAEEPLFDWSMKYTFVEAPNGAGKPRLETVDELESAIYTLYWWRQNNGMEDKSWTNSNNFDAGKEEADMEMSGDMYLPYYPESYGICTYYT